MLYSPSLPPSLFSLASSPCSHSIPLPTEAESRSSGIAAQPTQEPILAGAGAEPLHRRCPGRELLGKAQLTRVPSPHRSSHSQWTSRVPMFPDVQTWGCWCYPWCIHLHASGSPTCPLGTHRHCGGTLGRYQRESIVKMSGTDSGSWHGSAVSL